MTERVWTLEALKEHIESRLDAQQRAVDKAEESLTIRLEGMNEFRAQILRERSDYITQAVYEARHQQLVDRIDAAARWQSRMVGALTLVGFMLPIAVALIVYVLTRHAVPVTK